MLSDEEQQQYGSTAADSFISTQDGGTLAVPHLSAANSPSPIPRTHRRSNTPGHHTIQPALPVGISILKEPVQHPPKNSAPSHSLQPVQPVQQALPQRTVHAVLLPPSHAQRSGTQHASSSATPPAPPQAPLPPRTPLLPLLRPNTPLSSTHESPHRSQQQLSPPQHTQPPDPDPPDAEPDLTPLREAVWARLGLCALALGLQTKQVRRMLM